MAVKTFNTLIRLHKRRIDLLRREMRALEEERNQLLGLSRALEEEFAREIALSAEDVRLSGFFGAYALRVRKRQEDIARETTRLAAAIEEKAEAIRSEFAEQKKFEIARTHTLHQAEMKEKQRQQVRFDEIGNQQYLKMKEQPV